MAFLSSLLPHLITKSLRELSNGNHSTNDDVPRFPRYHAHVKQERLLWISFLLIAVGLLGLCALLAGLTLAISSLDITMLHVLSSTGSPTTRNRAMVIARIKRRETWFMCSMIISSVVAMETMPIVIQIAFGADWPALVVSTCFVGLFAEILPQVFIPRHALLWGYYSWPLIWSFMWLTCIISWPLAFLIDKIAGKHDDRTIYDNEQLSMLMKYHERTEKHGGHMGQEASRAARGAIDLDGGTLLHPSPLLVDIENRGMGSHDLEKGHRAQSTLIVPWESVRCLKIDDEVTDDLIADVKKWGCSRLPVVGPHLSCPEAPTDDSSGDAETAEQVFGVLHIKNLIGLNFQSEKGRNKGLKVKDLKLYSVPLVRDDLPIYDLLKIFQFGMSRIAVVVQAPMNDRKAPLTVSPSNLDTLPRYAAPLWSSSHGVDNRDYINMRVLDAQIDWSTDLLDAAQHGLNLRHKRKQSAIGAKCPLPIGIVTFEDVIDMMLKKNSRDEEDHFGVKTLSAYSKATKEGDTASALGCHSTVVQKHVVPIYVSKAHSAFDRSRLTSGSYGTLRKRNAPTNASGEYTLRKEQVRELDGANDCRLDLQRSLDNIDGSYNHQSRGNFPGIDCSENQRDPKISLAKEGKDTKLLLSVPSLRIVSSPAGKSKAGEMSRGLISALRHASLGATPFLPRLQRVTSFSSQNFSNSEMEPSEHEGSLDTVCHESQERQLVPVQPNSDKSDLHIDMLERNNDRPGSTTTQHMDESLPASSRINCANEAVKCLTLFEDLQAGAAQGNHPNIFNPNLVNNEVSSALSAETLSIPMRDTKFQDDRSSLPSQKEEFDPWRHDARSLSF